MGLNFRKSISILPGVKVNLSKGGVSLSGGVKGLRKSINTKGQTTTTVSIPGTGIYYTDRKKITNPFKSKDDKKEKKEKAEKKTKTEKAEKAEKTEKKAKASKKALPEAAAPTPPTTPAAAIRLQARRLHPRLPRRWRLLLHTPQGR